MNKKEERDKKLAARYVYWTEQKRRRFDDVTIILAKEFFLSEKTVERLISEQNEHINHLLGLQKNKK